VGYLISPERKLNDKSLTEDDQMDSPPSFPPSGYNLMKQEGWPLHFEGLWQSHFIYGASIDIFHQL